MFQQVGAGFGHHDGGLLGGLLVETEIQRELPGVPAGLRNLAGVFDERV